MGSSDCSCGTIVVELDCIVAGSGACTMVSTVGAADKRPSWRAGQYCWRPTRIELSWLERQSDRSS